MLPSSPAAVVPLCSARKMLVEDHRLPCLANRGFFPTFAIFHPSITIPWFGFSDPLEVLGNQTKGKEKKKEGGRRKEKKERKQKDCFLTIAIDGYPPTAR